MSEIRHVWFDFSDTIATPDKRRHAALRYSTFARLKGVKETPELRLKYDGLYKRYGSHSNIFVQVFGLDSAFWPGEVAKIANEGYYKLMDKNIPSVLEKLSKSVPVSIFSNIHVRPVITDLGINPQIFTHILSSAELRHPKPDPEGYKYIAELSGLPPEAVLYIGDLEHKDVLPAKSVGLRTGIIWNESKEADYTFQNFQEILDLFKA